jgi:predicted phosphodiesterase
VKILILSDLHTEFAS